MDHVITYVFVLILVNVSAPDGVRHSATYASTKTDATPWRHSPLVTEVPVDLHLAKAVLVSDDSLVLIVVGNLLHELLRCHGALWRVTTGHGRYLG